LGASVGQGSRSLQACQGPQATGEKYPRNRHVHRRSQGSHCTMNMDRANDSQLHDHASVLSTGIHVLPACRILWRRILGETGKHDRRTVRKLGHQ